MQGLQGGVEQIPDEIGRESAFQFRDSGAVISTLTSQQ